MKILLWDSLSKLLTERHMSISALSRKEPRLNIGTLVKIKSGHTKQPSYRTVQLIADTLGVSMDVFRDPNL